MQRHLGAARLRQYLYFVLVKQVNFGGEGVGGAVGGHRLHRFVIYGQQTLYTVHLHKEKKAAASAFRY